MFPQPAMAEQPPTQTARQGLLSNRDLAVGGPSYLPTASATAHRLPSPMPLALTMLSHGMPIVSSVGSKHQAAAAAAAYTLTALDVAGHHHQMQKQIRSSNQNSPYLRHGEAYEMLQHGTLPIEEEAWKTSGAGAQSLGASGTDTEYPEEVMERIRHQMQFYFSNENLPGDKFLNENMDEEKFIPLELFLDFPRIKPMCNSIDLLTAAVETISVLELSDDRKKVRVSQCRKTLTLRGFPLSTTEHDVRQFILEMGADAPTHIEFVMYKDNYSVWYVSFSKESAALNSFFQFHNQKAVYKGHTIGCCIKSSGTLAAAGYFPSMEDSSQRRLAYHNQAAAAAVGTAPVHTVQNPISQPQVQQPQPVIQPFNTMQLHSYLAGSPANIYYQQTPQGSFLPYMAGMIHSWPAPAAAMEPGLIMQNNGLQPQHIRTSMPRAHLMPTGNNQQHRFSRPQRTRHNNPERSNDRPSVVSMPVPPPASPHSSDHSVTAVVVSQEAYMPRRATLPEDVTAAMMAQSQMVNHKFAAAVATQHQAHIVTTAAASTALLHPSGLESMSVGHYQSAQQHQHQHQVMIQAAVPATTSAPPPHITSNPPPNTQMLHHQHIQPPPPIPQHPQHHHQPPPPQTVHHHHQQQQQQHYQQSNHSVQHSNQLPPQPQHQPAAQVGQHQHHPAYQHHMAQHQQQQHHYHNSQQHHHHQQQYLPPQSHQQSPPGNRTDKRNRRKRDDNVRSQRLERSQSNRAHFSSQNLAAVDNFTMEANSFPPLPGTLSSLSNAEVSHESRMADIVRGISRNASLSNSHAPRASPSTPSPVATPPASLASGSVAGQHQGLSQSSLVDAHSLDDDDATYSSQDDVDTDVNTFETKVVRSDLHGLSSMAEATMLPSQSRPQKVNTAVRSPAALQAPRQADNRQSSLHTQAPGTGPQQTGYSFQQVSAVIVSTSETPKLSYAQILAHKNREAASNPGNGEGPSPGGVPPNPTSGASTESNLHNCSHASNTSNSRQAAQSAHAFREHGNYQGGGQQYGHRPSQRGSSKDGMPRPDGPPPARQPNGGRRNSKENRVNNKFDRRKPDLRQK